MLRIYLVCREKQANGTWEKYTVYCNSDPVTSTSELSVRQKVSLRMLTNFKLPDLHLTTAQQKTTGQNLPFDLYVSTTALSERCFLLIYQPAQILYIVADTNQP
jgi:hypothetical protein